MGTSNGVNGATAGQSILDGIVAAHGEQRAAEQPSESEMARRAALVDGALALLNGGDVPATIGTHVPDEEPHTTFTALAELFDAKRDRHVETLAGLCGAYGTELQKRVTGMTSALAAPLLKEMRRALDAAEAAQKRAIVHRARA